MPASGIPPQPPSPGAPPTGDATPAPAEFPYSAVLCCTVAGTRWRLGWSVPAVALLIMVAAWWLRLQPGNQDLPQLAVVLVAAVLLGGFLQGVVRGAVGVLLGEPPRELLLGAAGARWEAPALRGMALLAVTLAGTASSWVAAALLAQSAGGVEAVAALWRTASPELVGNAGWAAVALTVAWVFQIQGWAQLLPCPGLSGRDLWQGTLETVRPGWAPPEVQSAVARVVGAIAIGLGAAAFGLWVAEAPEGGLPAWPFVMLLALLTWQGRHRSERAEAVASSEERPHVGPTASHPGPIDGPESGEPGLAGHGLGAPGLGNGGAPPSETPVVPPPPRRPATKGELTWWQRRRIRRAHEAEFCEAIDLAQADAVLQRLHSEGAESLTDADRELLQRVSLQLRQHRTHSAN